MGDQLDRAEGLGQMMLPDIWQQQAIHALREGRDVVAHAPTGAGKTLIFEAWANYGRPKGRAIYTVPTRALANDKLAEWRRKGWDVGIATGDVVDRTDAPIVVATLETQKAQLMGGDGPDLLVIDEYQLLGDEERGLNYELALALAPETTRFLALSGSVANPEDICAWWRRLGRNVELIRNDVRPTPLEEVQPGLRGSSAPSSVRGYWPELVYESLAQDLGPILIFAPRRRAAEKLARELAAALPTPHPLPLTAAQKALLGPRLVSVLEKRIAYHHSGLSYGARAGVIEPLAKAGQLRVVVATMGLAAGINFSLRSVAVAGTSYFKGLVESPIREDELLQMFGRAGRRGIDEIGYIIVTSNRLRLRDAAPARLTRTRRVDWGAALSLMGAAVDRGDDPFATVAQTQSRLFTEEAIPLGIEYSLARPDAVCGLRTDTERARHVRSKRKQFLNSGGEWEDFAGKVESSIGELISADPLSAEAYRWWKSMDSTSEPRSESPGEPGARALRWGPASRVESIGAICGKGEPVALEGSDVESPRYGRRVKISDLDLNAAGYERLVKWAQRLLELESRRMASERWESGLREALTRRIKEVDGLNFVEERVESGRRYMIFDIEDVVARGVRDRFGNDLWRPPMRDVAPSECRVCPYRPGCLELTQDTSPALLWLRLGLIQSNGAPTSRGRIVGLFSNANGLAIAAGIEDSEYSVDRFVFDLANLDAGDRFSEDGSRYSGRLVEACLRIYGRAYAPGYLDNGVPPKYGEGASEIMEAIYRGDATASSFVSPVLGLGDIDRARSEWRSLLRQIVCAPPGFCERWDALRMEAERVVGSVEPVGAGDWPPLDERQLGPVSHRLR